MHFDLSCKALLMEQRFQNNYDNHLKHHSNAGVSVPVTVPDIRVDKHKGSL